MNWRIVGLGLGALLLAGCGALNSPKPNAGANAAPQADDRIIIEPIPTTRPADAATTRPAENVADAAMPRLDPQAYAKAVEAYLNRRDAATTRPAARIPEFDPPPTTAQANPSPTRAANPVADSQPATAPAVAQAKPPKQAPQVEWIEPSTAQAAEQPGEPAKRSAPPAVAFVPRQVEGDSLPLPAKTLAPAVPQVPPSLPPGPTSDELEAQLTKQIKTSPRDLAAHLDYQLLQLLRGKQVPQLDAIASLSAEDREVLSTLLDALANFRTSAHDDNLMISRKIRPLAELSDRLRTQASLHIPTIALCTSVRTFGVYDPVESGRFLAGREHAVMVYCEIENFLSRLNGRNFWETNLTHEAILYNDRGLRVHAEAKLPVTDLSRNRRHDLFTARKVRVPAGLPLGKYQLVVTITDQQAQRVTEASVPVEIVAEK